MGGGVAMCHLGFLLTLTTENNLMRQIQYFWDNKAFMFPEILFLI